MLQRRHLWRGDGPWDPQQKVYNTILMRPKFKLAAKKQLISDDPESYFKQKYNFHTVLFMILHKNIGILFRNTSRLQD